MFVKRLTFTSSRKNCQQNLPRVVRKKTNIVDIPKIPPRFFNNSQ
jgi:hypothetical protein